MKKLFLLFVVASVVLISCDKDCDHDDLPCELVNSKLIPGIVADSVNAKYPGVVVLQWFNKDNKGYCAHFMVNNKITSALFDNNGKFIREGDDNKQQEGQHKDDDGCECEED